MVLKTPCCAGGTPFSVYPSGVGGSGEGLEQGEAASLSIFQYWIPSHGPPLPYQPCSRMLIPQHSVSGAPPNPPPPLPLSDFLFHPFSVSPFNIKMKERGGFIPII